ncbi:SDR family NAD(P)-dependent oxidoreductase [Silvimonas sp.]|uniref:SDR family NAD(P)-dependent oxidoreductase n=1 Tax=Silvimonas sp. TaxID=2650811 RepID=UPI002850172E|nr:SDR family NAD(P)-dependent oxidoreductase [Silvimonas sp.]MDR3429641.1 SDR family NAD(P)-dependent oxidoreductase [Silvimonas sp.]
MYKVWLVTGSASGLGRAIAEEALAAGDQVVATARDPQQLADLRERYGDQVRVAALDVTDQQAAIAAVQLAVDEFGRLDVVINNAGYGHIAPFEQTSAADFTAQIDTNFFGVVNVSRAAVPVMRAQRSGHIIQVSSVGGRMGTPGLSAYQAAKWAVGGFTEVLAQELTPLGIKVCALEPGGMRTNWGPRASQHIPQLWPEYEASVGGLLALLKPHIGHENSDPARIAQVVLRLAYHDAPPAHLLLGSDALQYAGLVEADRAAAGERWRAVSATADATETGPIPPLPLH